MNKITGKKQTKCKKVQEWMQGKREQIISPVLKNELSYETRLLKIKRVGFKMS